MKNSVTWHGGSRHLAMAPQWMVHHPWAGLLTNPFGWYRGVAGFPYCEPPRIANLFPPADRLVFVASDRQRIASIGGGGTCCSRHLGTCSLPFLRCVCPRFSAGDYAGNRTNWRENTLHRPITGPRRHSPVMSPEQQCRPEPPRVGVEGGGPADIQGGDAVADEVPSGLSDALAVRSEGNRLTPIFPRSPGPSHGDSSRCDHGTKFHENYRAIMRGAGRRFHTPPSSDHRIDEKNPDRHGFWGLKPV